MNEQQLTITSDDILLEQKIGSFIDEYEVFKNGRMLKSTEEVPVVEAIAYIDETFNYTYAFPITSYTKMLVNEAYLEIPLTSNGKVYKYCDLFATYDQVVETVRSIYNSYIEQNKRVIGLQLEDYGYNPQTGNERIRIVSKILTGTGVPINAEDDFDYARDTHRCDGSLDYGAANIVEWETNFVLNPAPPPNYHVYYTGVITWQPDPFLFPNGDDPDNFEDYYIYYGSYAYPNWNPSTGGTKCIEDYGVTGSEMSFYIESMLNEVIDYFLTDPILNQEQRTCTSIIVYSFDTPPPAVIVKHVPQIDFGFKHISIGHSQYPMSIE